MRVIISGSQQQRTGYHATMDVLLRMRYKNIIALESRVKASGHVYVIQMYILRNFIEEFHEIALIQNAFLNRGYPNLMVDSLSV